MAKQEADFVVEIVVNVTAKSPEEAARFALDDLRDREIGPWNVHVIEGRKYVFRDRNEDGYKLVEVPGSEPVISL